MELWKTIPGFEGIYEASNLGRIRSSDGKTTTSSIHGVVHWKQRIIKQHCGHGGRKERSDARVTLWKNKKPHYYLVSRLIALTWCEGYKDGMTVNHIDGNPMNNRADNLEWISLGDNIRHGFENDLYSTQKRVELVSPDGRSQVFRSMACASRYLGKNVGYISGMLKKGYRTLPNGYSIIKEEAR